MVRFPKDSKFSLSNLSAETFAAQWEILSDEAYDNLIKDCLDIRQRLSLCDWAYVELLQMAAEAVCGKTNDAVFLQAYIYVQTGYQMRLAMSQTNKLYMLVGSECRIYNRTYYVIDGTNFYPLNCEEKKLYISGAKFQDEKGLSLLINSEQGFNEDKKYRSLQSASGVHAQVCVNKNQMDFYNKYPTAMLNDDFSSRWMFYANAPMSKTVKESLYPYLRNALKGRGELESVSLLLNFVQTAFQYEYDDKVWGHDRAFFAEESLYYPYCDCEDRSILFSRLVRDLLGLNVVLLYYPGHLAAAVHFNSEVKGDYLIISDRKYIVCDPTYIGAPVGETMPEMDNHTAKVIMLGR